jgi:dethiobiotin synthetase
MPTSYRAGPQEASVRRIWVTGTDTGAGKTACTACLAAAFRERGLSVRALKPIASGVAPGTWGEDAELLALGGGHEPLVHTRLEAPVSPHRAAILEGRPLDLASVGSWIASQAADVVLVEGVGGWRVPLDLLGSQLRDLVARAPGEVLVVAPDRLGTLNHTRLTVEAIRADGLAVAAILLNGGVGAPDDPSRRWNEDDLRALVDVPLVRVGAADLADVPSLAESGRDAADLLLRSRAGGKL